MKTLKRGKNQKNDPRKLKLNPVERYLQSIRHERRTNTCLNPNISIFNSNTNTFIHSHYKIQIKVLEIFFFLHSTKHLFVSNILFLVLSGVLHLGFKQLLVFEETDCSKLGQCCRSWLAQFQRNRLAHSVALLQEQGHPYRSPHFDIPNQP